MNRLLMMSAASLIAGFSMTPAVAQNSSIGTSTGERVNQVIIYGDDDCPESEGNTITVCARMDESERYRIPSNLRTSNSRQNESWTARARSLETVGAFGALSCTPAGSGGELGCTAKMIEEAYQERAQSSDVRFAQLIEEERAARLAGIDDEAAATQERVEELERAYLERLERERDADLPGEEAGAQSTSPEAAPQPTSDGLFPPSDVGPPVFEEGS